MAAACLKNEHRLPVRLMFQDEARFGRMSDPRSCWAPAPHRPVVGLALIREFRYEYAAYVTELLVNDRILEIRIIDHVEGFKNLKVGEHIVFLHDIPAETGKIHIIDRAD